MTRALLAAGVVGPPLFVLTFLVEGATRPGYSWSRNFVSQLATGDGGVVQIANFLVCGALVLAFAVGLARVLRPRSRWGPLLVAAFAGALLVAGVFVTDPALGYPPGSPRAQTLAGTIHGLAGLAAFLTLSAACFVMARYFAPDPRRRAWAAYSLLSGLLALGSFVASNAAAVLDERGSWPDAPAGLFQRIGIVAGWAWVAALAWTRWRGYVPTTTPPSTERTAPLMKDASSDARNR